MLIEHFLRTFFVMTFELETREGLLLQRAHQHVWDVAEHELGSHGIRVQVFIFYYFCHLLLKYKRSKWQFMDFENRYFFLI